GVRKEYRLKTGILSRKTIEAVKDASFTLYPGRTLGVVGEAGSGKAGGGRVVAATARGAGRTGAVSGQRSAVYVRRRVDGVPAQDPDHLPEPVREPEPTLHGRPDPARADEDPRHRRQRRRPVRAGGDSGPARRLACGQRL